MHKRTAHALIDGDDDVYALSQNSLESSSQNKIKKTVKESVSTIYTYIYKVTKQYKNDLRKKDLDSL